MIYVDSHVHLDDAVYEKDREEVLYRAQENDVRIIAAVCCIAKIGDADITLSLMEKEGIYGIFGVHPHDARYYNDELRDYVMEIMQHPKAIAIGEIGLDYHYNYSTKEEQLFTFEHQIEIAQKINKPIVVHSREARQDTLELLSRLYDGESNKVNGIMHCYSGDVDMAMQCIRLGFLISFSGVITFENAVRIRDVVKKVPMEYILSETDSPYLAPVPHRGKRNEPAYVVKVTNKISEIKNLSIKEVTESIVLNIKKVIGK